MPLYKNTYQPFFPDTNSPNPRDCNGEYCYLVALGDLVIQEWWQTPCAASLVVDPLFEDVTIGAELLTNPDFTGSAASWTLGTNWVYGTDAITHTPSGPGGYDSVTQGPGLVIFPNVVYQLVVDLTTWVDGYLELTLGGAATSVYINTQGVYTTYIYAGNVNTTIDLYKSTDFSGTVSSISLKEVTYSSWETSSVWVLADEKACKTLTGTGILYNSVSDYITSGDYYVMQVTVSSYTSGSVALCIDDGTGATQTNTQASISSNGTYTYYITASQDGVIGFVPTSDFVGCLSTPTVQALRNDFLFYVWDYDGNSYNVSDQVQYVDNKVLLELDISLLEVQYGCYYIEVTDSCLVSGDDVVLNGDFADGTDDWELPFGAYQYDISGGTATFIFEPLGDGANLVTNGDFSSGSAGWTVGAGWAIGGGVATHTPGSTAALSRSITLSPVAVSPAILVTWWQFTIASRTAGSLSVTISDKSGSAYTINDIITNFVVPTIGGSVTISLNPSSTFDGTVTDIAVHESTRQWYAKPFITNPSNALIVAGNYQNTYDIVSITGTTASTIGGWTTIQYMTQGQTYDVTVGSKTLNIADYVPGLQKVVIGGNFITSNNVMYPGRIEVDNVTSRRVEPFDATYTSECLKYAFSFPNTKVVTGWCDQDALGSTYQDAFGFVTSGFLLQMRIECRSLNPVIVTGANVAKFGNGNANVTYAQLEKVWQFWTGYMSESALTTLGAMIRCDHFTVGESSADAIEYVAEVEDLQPQWIASGSYSLAPALINLRLKTGGMKFNRHT